MMTAVVMMSTLSIGGAATFCKSLRKMITYYDDDDVGNDGDGDGDDDDGGDDVNFLHWRGSNFFVKA